MYVKKICRFQKGGHHGMDEGNYAANLRERWA